MIVAIQPSTISGTVQAPASKSAMQRACAAALIRNGESRIYNPGHSNDDNAAIHVIRQLGAAVEMVGNHLFITSAGVQPLTDVLHCGESGLGIRMFTPIASLSDRKITITGEGSLVNRPMDFFSEVLPRLGVQVVSDNGKLPLTVKGPLHPRDIEVDGSLSSQFLTGLLMSYSAAGASNTTITVHNLKSRPYIDLTLQILQQFGLPVPEMKDYREFYFHTSPPSPAAPPVSYTVEGDWSGGAFLLVAGALAGEVRVNGLFNTSRQADKKIVDALLDAGADMTVADDHVVARKASLQPFHFDATDCPDLFPPLVALAAHCEGPSHIRGLSRLKHKESDRGLTLQEEFGKLGTRIDLDGNEMIVHGNAQLRVRDHILNSHHDHRIAMACAVACLRADLEVEIRQAEAVKKSYPDFWDHMKSLNAALSLKPFTTDNTFTL